MILCQGGDLNFRKASEAETFPRYPDLQYHLCLNKSGAFPGYVCALFERHSTPPWLIFFFFIYSVIIFYWIN